MMSSIREEGHRGGTEGKKKDGGGRRKRGDGKGRMAV